MTAAGGRHRGGPAAPGGRTARTPVGPPLPFRCVARRDGRAPAEAETPVSGCPLGWRRRGAWRSLVSALVWGTRGPEFESRRPDNESPAHAGVSSSHGLRRSSPDSRKSPNASTRGRETRRAPSAPGRPSRATGARRSSKLLRDVPIVAEISNVGSPAAMAHDANVCASRTARDGARPRGPQCRRR